MDLSLSRLLNKENNSLFLSKIDKNLSIVEQSQTFFREIYALDELKENLYRNLVIDDQTNTLLIGPPASSKTLFVQIIKQNCRNVLFFDASVGSSGAGLIELLRTHQSAKILIIDEIDKLKKNDQNVLLSLLNDGTVEKSLKGITIKLKMSLKVFATSNSTQKLGAALKSRFEIYHLTEYDDETFIKVCQHCLRQKLTSDTAEIIAKILIENGQKNVRLAISITKKIDLERDTLDDIARVINNKLIHTIESEVDYN